MRKHCSNVCKLRPCLATESTISARIGAIVSAALQRQYSQTELVFWITLVYGCKSFSSDCRDLLLVLGISHQLVWTGNVTPVVLRT